MDNPIYQRYATIMPSVEGQERFWQSKLPKTFWVNTLRVSIEEFQAIVEEEQLDCAPVAWNKAVYRAGKDFIPTKHWTFAAGLLQMQEEAAMHCAYLLNLKLGDLALDTCAAPGNKSAQMAVLMQNEGSLIVNDMNFGRMRAFGQISKRLGLMNVTSCIYNAANLPKMPNYFDAIMVDVPCSCEGTFRKKWPKPQNPVSAENSKGQAKRQLAILNKAIQLAKPGAHLVYSTCTFSPYENEGVLTKALEKWGDQIELLPINISNFETSSGILKWEGVEFNAACQKAGRIWPHQNNTGGFFMALIRKRCEKPLDLGSPPVTGMTDLGVSGVSEPDMNLLSPGGRVKAHGASAQLDLLSPSGRAKERSASAQLDLLSPSGRVKERSDLERGSFKKDYLPDLQNRFGFPEQVFEKFTFHSPTKKGWYINPISTLIPDNLRRDATGLFFYKTAIKFPKLSTGSAMVFGKYATKNKILLDEAGRDCYLAKDEQVVEEEQLLNVTSTGYVLVFYKTFCLGVGLYFSPTEHEASHRLRSLIDLKMFA